VTLDASGSEVTRRFAENLVRIRRAAGLSQDDLARRTGIHPTVISDFERALHEPRLNMLIKLTTGLGVSVTDLTKGIRWEPGSPMQRYSPAQPTDQGFEVADGT